MDVICKGVKVKVRDNVESRFLGIGFILFKFGCLFVFISFFLNSVSFGFDLVFGFRSFLLKVLVLVLVFLVFLVVVSSCRDSFLGFMFKNFSYFFYLW